MTPTELEKLERLAEAATKGLWEYEPGKIRPSSVWASGMQVAQTGYAKFDSDNAKFIAAARTAIPQLIAEVRKLREALENAADWMKVVHNTPIAQSHERCLDVIRSGARAAELEARAALGGEK